ncbi:MAG: NFACT RNA binding domain-containing protein [Planctomycetota bacterium]
MVERPWGSQPYPACFPGETCKESPSLLEAIRTVRSAAGTKPGLIPSGLTKALEDALSLMSKRAAKLRGELERSPEPMVLRRTGDLILAHLQRVPRGASEVTLPGFDGMDKTIDLDPALAPPENAARYYDRAGRAERARERLPDLIHESEEKRAALADLSVRVGAGTATEEEIRQALPERELRARTPQGEAVPGLPYRVYRTSGGLEVRVGRGSGLNDDLTFRHSKPDDIWLHARDSAGAHVILRWDGKGAPPARDLEEAAVLAALNSKARTSGSVPVDWTHRKHVRKPRKSAPGSVVPDRVKTLFVEPDPTLPDRLRD